MTGLPYIYRWHRQGRKGQPCRVVARSRMIRPTSAPMLAFGAPRPVRFNSVLVEFADGFRMNTSGNALQRAKP